MHSRAISCGPWSPAPVEPPRQIHLKLCQDYLQLLESSFARGLPVLSTWVAVHGMLTALSLNGWTCLPTRGEASSKTIRAGKKPSRATVGGITRSQQHILKGGQHTCVRSTYPMIWSDFVSILGYNTMVRDFGLPGFAGRAPGTSSVYYSLQMQYSFAPLLRSRTIIPKP